MHNSLSNRKIVSFLKRIWSFSEVRWLSRGHVPEFGKCWRMSNKHLAILTDSSTILNNFNMELQGKRKNVCHLWQTIVSFKIKIFLIAKELKSRNSSNFPNIEIIFMEDDDNFKICEYVFYDKRHFAQHEAKVSRFWFKAITGHLPKSISRNINLTYSQNILRSKMQCPVEEEEFVAMAKTFLNSM